MTNGDKIRQMSNEELLNFFRTIINDFSGCIVCKYKNCSECAHERCAEGIKAYLDMEVEE